MAKLIGAFSYYTSARKRDKFKTLLHIFIYNFFFRLNEVTFLKQNASLCLFLKLRTHPKRLLNCDVL
jgi:hypothetical protein